MSCIHQCNWHLPLHYPNASAKVQQIFQITKNFPFKITFLIDLTRFTRFVEPRQLIKK